MEVCPPSESTRKLTTRSSCLEIDAPSDECPAPLSAPAAFDEPLHWKFPSRQPLAKAANLEPSFRRRRRRNRNPSPDAQFSSSMVPSSTTPRGGVSSMIASASVALKPQAGWPVKGVINIWGLDPPARTLDFASGERKKGSIRRKEPGIGGKPVMLVRRRVAHTGAPFILLVCGVAGVRLGAWRWMDPLVPCVRIPMAVVSERRERAGIRIAALTPLPVWERLAGETPVRAAGHLPLLCSAARLSLTACLAACPGAARPPAPQQLCHAVLSRARAKARADGRRGEREKRTPDRGEGWAEQKKNPGPQARPGPGLNWTGTE